MVGQGIAVTLSHAALLALIERERARLLERVKFYAPNPNMKDIEQSFADREIRLAFVAENLERTNHHRLTIEDLKLFSTRSFGTDAGAAITGTTGQAPRPGSDTGTG